MTECPRCDREAQFSRRWDCPACGWHSLEVGAKAHVLPPDVREALEAMATQSDSWDVLSYRAGELLERYPQEKEAAG